MARERQRPSQAVPANNAPAYHKSFAPREPWRGITEYGTTTSRAIREQIKKFVDQRPNKEWAARLIARHAAGEKVNRRGLDMAREVVGPPPEREPGSDDA